MCLETLEFLTGIVFTLYMVTIVKKVVACYTLFYQWNLTKLLGTCWPIFISSEIFVQFWQELLKCCFWATLYNIVHIENISRLTYKFKASLLNWLTSTTERVFITFTQFFIEFLYRVMWNNMYIVWTYFYRKIQNCQGSLSKLTVPDHAKFVRLCCPFVEQLVVYIL